ncbi:hypothetical protein PRK78_004845 [Emydomyces testavorans]|uniref:Homeobox domain-containing protein n=1 Tax=Emydomyces testavorans TaxID=2070801 RepID=A0AAF0DJC7_9EURO|nr:hypothetical protein PRK78_004845 [Emydomyces testavorans]
MGIYDAHGAGLSITSARPANGTSSFLSLHSESSINHASRSYSEDIQDCPAYAWASTIAGTDCIGPIETFNETQDTEYSYDKLQQNEDGSPIASSTTLEKPSRGKMKRFRLTHNQTRYLMSEFIRQAHPDAAHRERLSREIPGLSPRQVQVWFQNRRAKLKRLSTDDRERILKSRAVPDGFDMVKALHWPYANNPDVSNTAASANGDNTSERKESLIPVESIKPIKEKHDATRVSNPSRYGYHISTSLSALEPSVECDSISSVSALSERQLPFPSWTYPQIPTPPLESTSMSESGSTGESNSPLNHHWCSVSSGDSTTPISPCVLTSPGLNCGVNTPVTPVMCYGDKPFATPLPDRDFLDNLGSPQDDQNSAGDAIPTTPLSISFGDQLLQPSVCLGLGSFGISSQQTAPAVGFTGPAFGFEPKSSLAGLSYPIEMGRNMWDIGR